MSIAGYDLRRGCDSSLGAFGRTGPGPKALLGLGPLLDDPTMDAPHLRLGRSLSFDDRGRFMTEALDALERCGGRLRVDGSELLDFDDAGVALLVALGRYGASLGVQVELAGAPLLMRCAIETRGFGTLFTWTPKVPWAAIAGAVRDPVTVPSGRRWGAALNG